ncbi:hypothetical protein [Pseudocnuella soli]|uniref:hypothetical protein n=1 Tax=Pseudocnuella soli TaxID=2502779 RepID=UPI00104DE71D|nr:hypothetical protein [Pseudocnuella soli]
MEQLSKKFTDHTTSGTKDEPIHRYEKVLQVTADALNKLSENEKFYDIRLIGLVLMAVGLFFKLTPLPFRWQLATTEFNLIFSMGALLLMIGSYFKTKNEREKRETVVKAGEAAMNGWEAQPGPMRRSGLVQ